MGTVVAHPPKARAGDRKRLLEDEVEKLVVEADARRCGASTKCSEAVEDSWNDLRGLKAVSNDH